MQYELNFPLSRTESAYFQKPTSSDIKSMVFSKKKYTIDKFVEDIKEGYSFAYCFKTDNRPFKTYQKTNDNFDFTNVVVYDIDKSEISMKELIKTLPMKPTVAYTTPSNREKAFEYRYRLVYCFDDSMTSVKEYQEVYDKLKLKLDITISDNCMRSPSQMFNGNADLNIETYVSYRIYKLDSIKKTNLIEQKSINQNNNKKNSRQINPNDTESINQNNNKKSNRQINPNDTKLTSIFNSEFLSDFYKLCRRKFLLKYCCYLLDVKRESDLKEIDCRYSVYPDNYVRVPIKYRNRKLSKKHIRFKDGELRHKYIHIAGLVFRKLNPSITAEQLLYLLVDEIYNNYDNTDEKFNRPYMIKLTIEIMQEPIEQLDCLQIYDCPSFKVNKEYCTSTFQSAVAVSNQIRREKRYEQIDRYFDPSKTQVANLEILQQHNVKCSIATLKRYIKYKKEKHYSVDDPHYIFELTKMPLQNKKK